jgi:DNA primase
VAVPLSWDELMAGVDPQQLTVRSLMGRIGARGFDPWPGYGALKQQLSAQALRSLGLTRRAWRSA